MFASVVVCIGEKRRRKTRRRLLVEWFGPRRGRRKRHLPLVKVNSENINKRPTNAIEVRSSSKCDDYCNVSSRYRRCQPPQEAGSNLNIKISSGKIRRNPMAEQAVVGVEMRRLVLLIIVSLVCLLLPELPQPCSASSLSDYDGATFYKAPLGSGIRIACNGSRLSTDDQSAVSLILWFKNSLAAPGAGSGGDSVGSNSEPIYTVDARQRPLNGGARHFVSDAYKGRAKFVTKSWPPYLDLSPLEAEDQAEYRCRIDYRSKPRENFLIILFVLVPPKSLEIMDSSGRSLEQIYGPLSEGSDLTLVCSSKGGRPAPALTWKRGTKVIDDHYLTLNDYLALRQSERLWPASVGEQHPSSSSSGGSSSSSSRAQTMNSTRWPPADDHDNNLHDEQTRQTAANSISANPSLLSASQLRSLASEWRSQAEFQYYQLNESSLTSPQLSADQLQQQQTNRVRLAARKLAAGTAATSADPANSGEQSSAAAAAAATELLTLPVDESITTSVNVLKVVDLNSAAAIAEWQVQPSLVAGGGKLECLGSNLHYDLRTLIKLFAPPSLVSSSLSTANKSSRQTESTSAPTKGRQLAEAIERALEANLLSMGQPVPIPTGLSAQIGPDAALAATSQNNSEAAALKQHHIRAEFQQQQQQQQHRQQPAKTGELPKDDKQASIIYQQLSRPHQLASEWFHQQQQQQQQQRDPLERSRLIELDVYTRPLDVRISVGNLVGALSAGQLAEFTCTSTGSRPAAKLSWLKNNQPLRPELWRQIDEPAALNGSGRTSHSKLTLKLDRQDHGSKLTCRAENEQLARLLAADFSQQMDDKLSGRILEDSRTLVVNYPPRVKLELGNNIMSSAIREGTDIYFVCQIEAQPPVREITWLHNERQINSQQSSAVIISNNSLVLQRVKRHQRGQYACMASNSEGLSESNRIELRVLHAPVCSLAAASSIDDHDNDRGQQRQPYFAQGSSGGSGSSSSSGLLVERKRLRLHSRTKLVCQMEADPMGDLEFSWFLNNTLGQRQPLQSSAPPPSDKAGSSKLEFQPESGLDYGQIYCEARNSIGSQSRSCLYEIRQQATDVQGSTGSVDGLNSPELQDEFGRQNLPAGQQLACIAVNVTAHSALVGCELPASADSERQLQVEIFSQDKDSSSSGKQQLEANLTLEHEQQPLFLTVTNLRLSTNYLIRLAASLGQSEVQFSTESDGSQDVAAGVSPGVQLIGSETHRAHLMSTLISIRSTNGRQSAASTGGGFGSAGPNGVRWARVDSRAPSLANRLLDSLSSAFGSLFQQTPGTSSRLQLPRRQQQQQSNNLMDLSSTFLLTSLACLALVAMLGLSLLLLRRYSANSSSSRRGNCRSSSSSAGSSSTLSRSPPTQLHLERLTKSHENFYSQQQQQQQHQEKSTAASPSSPNTNSPAYSALKPNNIQLQLQPQPQQSQRLFAFGPQAQVAAATATLDMRKLASMRSKARQKSDTTCATPASSIQPQLYYSSTASESSPMATRVSKSRSSMCLESLTMEQQRPNSSQHQQQQQQQQHFNWLQLAAVNANSQPAVGCSTAGSTHLAADANSMAIEQHQQQQQQAGLIRDANLPHFRSSAGNRSSGSNSSSGTTTGSALTKCQDYEHTAIITDAAAACLRSNCQSSASGLQLCHSSMAASLSGNSDTLDSGATNLNSLHRLSRQQQQQQYLSAIECTSDRYAVVAKQPPQLVCCQSEALKAAANVTIEGGQLLAFDENQVQFIELLPDGGGQQLPEENDDPHMIQHEQQQRTSFLYDPAAGSNLHDEGSYLTIGQVADRLQLIEPARQQQWFLDSNCGAGDSTANKQIREQHLGKRLALGSSLASCSLASSSLNDQANSISPISSSQTNTTPPSNSSANVQRAFYEPQTAGIGSAQSDQTIKRFHQQQKQQQSGILKNRQDDPQLTCLCDETKTSNKL